MTDLLDIPVEEAEREQTAEESAHLLSFLYACPVGLMEISSDGAIGLMNPVAMQLLLRLSPVPSANLFEATATQAPELRSLILDFAPRQGTIIENHRILVRVRTDANPELEVLSCTVVKLGAERYTVSLSDVSNQVRQERKLQEAEAWFGSLFDGAFEFVAASLDRTGRIASVSASLPQHTGFSEAELLGQTLDFLEVSPAPDGARKAQEQLALAAREGWHLGEDWQRHRDGSRVWYQRLIAVRHDHGTHNISGYTLVLREGQQRSMDAQKLREMLTRDYLTGAYNRMHFFEIADRECAREKRSNQPLSLIIADIDHFKQVNDSYGHAAGDHALQQFVQICLSHLRPGDSISRIGGEEFAILLPETTLEGAHPVAERLRLAISSTSLVLENSQLAVTASFGYAQLRPHGALAAMIADADAALYEAKRRGRNCVVAKSPA